MCCHYNHWNSPIPRSYNELEPAHVRRKIGSQLYDGKSLKGKGGQKALLVAKVMGVTLGTFTLILIPVLIKKKLYQKACIWMREIYYDQKLSLVHLKSKEILIAPLLDQESSSSHSIEASLSPFSNPKFNDVIPLILQSTELINNSDLVHYLGSTRQVSKQFCDLIDNTVKWNLFNLGALKFSNINHLEGMNQLINYIVQAKHKFTKLDLPADIEWKPIHNSTWDLCKWSEDMITQIMLAQPNLETLYIPDPHKLTYDFFEKLTNLKNLKRMRVNLDDNQIALVVAKFPLLEEIEIGKSTTKISLEAIYGLKSLKSLHIHSIQKEGIALLVKNHPHLEELKIELYTDGIEEILKFKKLKKLILNGRTECDLPNFDPLIHLESLDLDLQIDSIDCLLSLKNLSTLNLVNLKVQDLSKLEQLENLKSLKLSCLEKLEFFPAEMKSLEKLDIYAVPNLKMISISGFPKLKSLKINGAIQLSIEGSFENLKALSELSLIQLKGVENPDSLNAATELKFLKLHDIEDLKSFPINEFKKLISLKLQMCSIEEVLFIEKFSSLKTLFIRHCHKLKIKGSFNLLLSLENLTLGPTMEIEDFSFSKQLRKLEIADVYSLQKLDFTALNELKELRIRNCLLLESIYISGLINLESLSIYNCNKMQVKGSFLKLENANEIVIQNCQYPSLTHMTELNQLNKQGLLKFGLYNDIKIK